MEIQSEMLDKIALAMVKYSGIKYRVERKEYRISNSTESSGHGLEASAVYEAGKCIRERRKIP